MSSKRQLRFKEADVSRALKGALKGGLDVARVEIDASGRIVIMAKGAGEAHSPDDPEAALSAWEREYGQREVERRQ